MRKYTLTHAHIYTQDIYRMFFLLQYFTKRAEEIAMQYIICFRYAETNNRAYDSVSKKMADKNKIYRKIEQRFNLFLQKITLALT